MDVDDVDVCFWNIIFPQATPIECVFQIHEHCHVMSVLSKRFCIILNAKIGFVVDSPGLNPYWLLLQSISLLVSWCGYTSVIITLHGPRCNLLRSSHHLPSYHRARAFSSDTFPLSVCDLLPLRIAAKDP